jgi:hypothetical protein
MIEDGLVLVLEIDRHGPFAGVWVSWLYGKDAGLKIVADFYDMMFQIHFRIEL